MSPETGASPHFFRNTKNEPLPGRYPSVRPSATHPGQYKAAKALSVPSKTAGARPKAAEQAPVTADVTATGHPSFTPMYCIRFALRFAKRDNSSCEEQGIRFRNLELFRQRYSSSSGKACLNPPLEIPPRRSRQKFQAIPEASNDLLLWAIFLLASPFPAKARYRSHLRRR